MALSTLEQAALEALRGKTAYHQSRIKIAEAVLASDGMSHEDIELSKAIIDFDATLDKSREDEKERKEERKRRFVYASGQTAKPGDTIRLVRKPKAALLRVSYWGPECMSIKVCSLTRSRRGTPSRAMRDHDIAKYELVERKD